MAKPPSQYVLMRHVLPYKHGDFERIRPMFVVPFDSNGSSSSAGIDALARFPRPSHRWMIAVSFPETEWVPLFSNTATPQEMFDANRNGRRIEIAWLGTEGRELFFRLVKAREEVVRFRGTDDFEIECNDVSLEQRVRQQESPVGAYDCLCHHFGISFPMRWVTEIDDQFTVVQSPDDGEDIKEYVVFSASGLAEGESSASDRLAKAIERGKPKSVKAAIADGASLDVLPETSLSPLVKAMFRCAKKRKWRECAQAIVDAGYPIEGTKRHGAPIFDACDHILNETTSIQLLEFLNDNGADLNRLKSSGTTVLDSSACFRRELVVNWLLEHGADPNIPTRGDKSIVDEMRTRVETERKSKTTSQYDGVLRLLEQWA